MITNLLQDGWQVIYHRSHALLAAQIAGHWKKSDSPERIYETIAAISHHDDLEKEWEGNELSQAGAPLDFTLTSSSSSSIKPLRKHIQEAMYRGRWVAFLTSRHITFLSQDKWGTSPEWDEFLKEQVKNQEEWRTGLGINKDQAERAYQFMQWSDRLSLILAQNQIPEAERALEISSGLDNVRYDVRQLADGKITVEPWPFEDDEFIVNIETCHLKQLQFSNNEELVKALHEAPIDTLEWTFSNKKEPS